jgi:hypothetical protein
VRHPTPIVALSLFLAVLGLLWGSAGGGAASLPGGWEQVGNNSAAPTQPALNGIVLALNTDQPGVMYVGGNFTDAGGDPNADYIARWDGTTWKALGAPKLNAQVTAIAYRNGKVYAGGTFTAAGGDTNAGFLAVWDGTKWSPVCKPSGPRGNVYALEISGSTIYVGGAFQRGAGIANANYLLACDLNTGAARAVVPGYTSSTVAGLAVDSHGTLYAGGGFGDLDGVPAADFVAAYSNGKWQALGSGAGPGGGAVTDRVRTVTARGTDVYIGGDFADVAGISQADKIAKWNGSAWSALGANAAGTNGIFPATSSVYAILVSGSRVFVGGAFTNANGNALSDNLVVYDGKSWQPLGSNGSGDGALRADVHSLAVFGGKLYAGGNFTSVGGVGPASFLVAYPLAGAPPGGGGGGGGGGGPGTTTTTTPSGGAAPPPTGTPTGTVLVNGRPFTGGRIPYNSTVDVTNGTLLLRADTGTLTVRGAGGLPAVFKLLRGTDNRRPIVELRLTAGDFSVCPKRKRSSASRLVATTVRQLWGNGKGSFRTRGRYATATVRGTNWLTADRCDGTQVRVVQGVIQVSDFPRRTQVTVRAGRSYLAKP